MGTTDYIVRFKGDYSALQKDINKINGETKKLADDEVIIKLNYDGNIKEFNKVFDQISKMHPELGIQFQYNVNEKILRQELDKLEKLSDLKLDIDEGKVSGKLKNLADNVESALKEGMSKNEITRRVNEFFGYYNTAIKAGAKNIDSDFDSINNRLYDLFENQAEEIKDIYNEIFDSNDKKKIELFKIDGSLNNDLVKTKERVDDLQNALKGLEEKGASKSGLPSELQRVQDEIKILRADIDSMKGELKNLSGDAFNDMTEQIKGTNEQLNYTLQTLTNLKRALASNDIKIKNSVGGVVKQWQSEEETKSYERYTAFNSQTRETSGAHLAADATGVSMKLMKAAIAELGDDAEGTIHSHPMKNAAFSDDDIERYITLFEESQGKIFLNSITSAEQAMSIDMRKVDISKKGEIVQTIKDSYKAIDDKYLGNLQLSVNEIKEDIMPLLNLKADNPIIGSVIKTIRENFDDLFDGIMNLDEFSDVFEENADYILKQIPELKQLSKEDRNNIMKNVGGYIDLLHDSILGTVSENAQKEYQRVLQEVFAKPEFLKSGENSAIKLEALTDFIDWGSIEDSAIEATKKAADAVRKAQDSNSPAELTKPLGKNFGEGYAEGIKEAIPDIVDACKQIVLAAYDAVKEANDSEDNEGNGFSEGFINSFKESLNNSLPDIQEKIKEIFSKLDINEEAYSNFETIGQNIVNSVISGINEHSQESLSDALERIINDAFTNIILNSAVQGLIEKMQRAMDYYLGNTPLQISHFDIETDSIVISIQNALDNKTFDINLGGVINDLSTALDTSAENVRMSFIDAIKWIQQANEWQKVNKDATHERALYFNSKTGEFSNPTVVGNEKSVQGNLSHTIIDYYKNKGISFDTNLHSHQDFDNAAPSPADLLFDFVHAYEDGINKYIVLAQKELTEIDFTKIASSRQDLASQIRDFFKNSDVFNINKLIKNQLDEDDDYLKIQAAIALDDIKEADDDEIIATYGAYIKALLDSEWENLKKDFIKSAEAKKKENFKGSYDFDLLKKRKNKISSDIGLLDSGVSNDSLIYTDIFDIFSDNYETNLYSTDFISEFLQRLSTNVDKGIKHTRFKTIEDIENSVNNIFEETEKLGSPDYEKLTEIPDKYNTFKKKLIEHVINFIDDSFRSASSILTDAEKNEAYQEAGKQALRNISEKTLLNGAVTTYSHDEFEKEFGISLSKNIANRKPLKQYTQDDLIKWFMDKTPNEPSAEIFGDFDESFFIKWKEKLLRFFPELLENQAKELFDLMRKTDSFDSNYNQDAFEKQYLSKINGFVIQNAHAQQSNKLTSQSFALPEDFQQQLQDAVQDAIQSVINSIPEMISSSFATSDIGKLIATKIQEAFEEANLNSPIKLYYFDVNTDNIVVQIQDALQNADFKIDISGDIQNIATVLDTSAENVRMSFIDAIRWMQQANEWQKVNKNATHERALYFNSKTGEFSNPTVVGNEHNVTSDLTNKVVDYYKKLGVTFDTDLHWHQDEDFAAPSYVTEWSDKLISGDLGSFFYNAFRNSFDKFIVAAQEELAVFDFTKIASSASELNDFLSKWITDNLSEVENKLEYNQYRDENLTDNPRKTVALYLSQIYGDIWKEIELGFHNIDYSSATLNQKQVRTHISDFGSHIMNYGEPDFMDLNTGELFPISDVFKDVIDKIRDSANVDSFEVMLGGIESDFEEVIVEIFHNIFMSLGDMDSINLDTIRNQVDKDTTKVLTESVKNQRAISEYGLNNYTSEIRDTLFNLLKENFFKPAVALNQDKVELQKAGSMAMKELISSNDLVGKLVKYYTPEEFTEEFGANIINNISATPIKQYIIEDLKKFVNDFISTLDDTDDFMDEEDVISVWKKKILTYFPELLESQANELYNLMASNGFYGDDLIKDEYLSEINNYVAQNARKQQSNTSQTQLPFSPILSEDFQTQLQNAIDESGRYLIKVYGELVDGFKSQLQQSIDEIGYLFVELKGRLSDDFKEALQSAVDSLEAIPIEVKPYVRKGSEIEEVDLPGGNQDTIESKLEEARKKIDAMNLTNVQKTLGKDLLNGGSISFAEAIDNIQELIDLFKELGILQEATKKGLLTQITTVPMDQAKPSVKAPVSAESTNAETKAFLSKKEVVQQLRAELNLTKKAAEDIFNEQGYSKTNGKYQIEQQAIDELITSLKEKKQIEESEQPTTTSPVVTSMQEEVSVVDAAIESEKKKFDELKRKISTSIPNAIKKKNEAFKAEADLVSRLVGGESKEFDNLKDSIDGVTDSVKNQKKASDNKSTRNTETTSDESNRDTLLQQYYTDLRRDAYQSIGQKSDIQTEMSKYYAELEKTSSAAYANASKKTDSLLNKIKKLQTSGKYTDEFIAELNLAQKELNDFSDQLKSGGIPFEEVESRVTALSEKIEGTLAKKAFGSVKQAAEKSLTNIGLKIDQIIAKNSAMGDSFKSRFENLRKELDGAKSIEEVQRIVAEVNKLESELVSAGKTGRSFIDQIKQRLRDINSKYIAQYFSFQDIIRYARQAAQSIIELNDAFIELSKVSNTSIKELESDFQSYADIAKDIGGTISDTISATADWARMGYSVPDSKQLAEVAMLYKNVGDGIDISQANESLISTLQGYQMGADEAEHIVDVFNEVANNFAIDTGGIGEALQRSASSLNAANTSLEESVALVTAANTVVQNPESVGTTFKTLSARIRGATTELEELGEEGDEFTETTSKLQGLIKSLTGFDILESDQKTFKSIYDILIGIGKEWKNLDDIEQASLGEALAGKRNANTLYAVLDNIDTLEAAYQKAEESAGSAQREQENYQKGITYSINQAKAALEELAYDLASSDFLKGLVDTGTKGIELVDNLIDKFGTLKTVIVGIGTVWGSQKLGYCN